MSKTPINQELKSESQGQPPTQEVKELVDQKKMDTNFIYKMRANERNTHISLQKHTSASVPQLLEYRNSAPYIRVLSILASLSSGMGVQRAYDSVTKSSIPPPLKFKHYVTLPLITSTIGLVSSITVTLLSFTPDNVTDIVLHQEATKRYTSLYHKIKSNLDNFPRRVQLGEEDVARRELETLEQIKIELDLHSPTVSESIYRRSKEAIQGPHGFKDQDKKDRDVLSLTQAEMSQWTTNVKLDEMAKAEQIAQLVAKVRESCKNKSRSKN